MCDFCDQPGHNLQACAVKRALTAGIKMGMVNGFNAGARYQRARAHGRPGPRYCMQEFDIICFSVAAELEPPSLTANLRVRGEPYDALNDTEDRGQGKSVGEPSRLPRM
jgi:hypothetical protein